uniref:Uncharacterized protein n=1 Tax=Cacopsylla melanoneura TaxID=428564 RepID=A0A8D8XDP5_9HEMI
MGSALASVEEAPAAAASEEVAAGSWESCIDICMANAICSSSVICAKSGCPAEVALAGAGPLVSILIARARSNMASSEPAGAVTSLVATGTDSEALGSALAPSAARRASDSWRARCSSIDTRSAKASSGSSLGSTPNS